MHLRRDYRNHCKRHFGPRPKVCKRNNLDNDFAIGLDFNFPTVL